MPSMMSLSGMPDVLVVMIEPAGLDEFELFRIVQHWRATGLHAFHRLVSQFARHVQKQHPTALFGSQSRNAHSHGAAADDGDCFNASYGHEFLSLYSLFNGPRESPHSGSASDGSSRQTFSRE